MALKFLIIDDEYLVRERLKHIVNWEAEGFILCGEAENGELAIELIKKVNPELVIVDINMPKLTGLEVAGIISEDKMNTKVVILSGYNDFEYARSAIRFGVYSYLLKPVNKEELLETIRNIRKSFGVVNPLYSKTVKQVISYIGENYRNMGLNVDMIASHVGMNTNYLSSKFKKETGRKLVDEINLFRLKKAEEILKIEICTLQDLADQVGYNDPYYMSRCFRKYLGYSPSQLMNR